MAVSSNKLNNYEYNDNDDGGDDDNICSSNTNSCSSSRHAVKNRAERIDYKGAAMSAPILSPYFTSDDDLDGLVTTMNRVRITLSPTNTDLIAYICSTQPPPIEGKQQFRTWEEYQEYVAKLPYPSEAWKNEHAKFMTASTAATALGIRGSPKSSYQLWCELVKHSCLPKSKPKNSFVEYMMARGLQMEPFINELYLRTIGEQNICIRRCVSTIHPTFRWFMATPDGIVVKKDPITGAEIAVRTVEWKAPYRRDAFLTVPDDYMVQIQLTMAVTGSAECDFASFKVNDYDLKESEFIVHRVYRDNDYIAEAFRILRMFCRAVRSVTRPPKPTDFKPPRGIVSTMILRLTDVVSLVPNGASKIREAIRQAKRCAEEVVLSQQYK